MCSCLLRIQASIRSARNLAVVIAAQLEGGANLHVMGTKWVDHGDHMTIGNYTAKIMYKDDTHADVYFYLGSSLIGHRQVQNYGGNTWTLHTAGWMYSTD